MNRRSAIAAAALAVLGRQAFADDSFLLVTNLLAERERQFEAENKPNARVTRSFSPYPRIKIVAPHEDGTELHSPVRIELAFETSSDARIVPSTFRLLYGYIKFDLTENVRENATITEHGLVAEKAAVPRGAHRLFLQIADDKGRVVEQELRVNVS
jgi:hypothetical protein